MSIVQNFKNKPKILSSLYRLFDFTKGTFSYKKLILGRRWKQRLLIDRPLNFIFLYKIVNSIRKLVWFQFWFNHSPIYIKYHEIYEFFRKKIVVFAGFRLGIFLGTNFLRVQGSTSSAKTGCICDVLYNF